jgi:hypothetical protein
VITVPNDPTSHSSAGYDKIKVRTGPEPNS